MKSHLEIGIYSNKLTNFKWKTLKKVSTVFRVACRLERCYAFILFQKLLTFD